MNWIEVNGTSLRYELSGSRQDHAGAGARDGRHAGQLGPGAAGAEQHARRVLRYDTRGAGLSEKIDGKVTFDDMADDLAALLDATGIKGKVAIAGTAVGGAIAIHFAVRHAARAGALAVTSPATGVACRTAPGNTGPRRGGRGERHARVWSKAGVANSYPPEVRHNAEDFRKFRARWLANDPQSFAAINRMLADSTVTEELPRIACPTLVIGCTHDRLRPPSDVEPMAKQIPGAEYMKINSGHFAGIQTPGLVSQAFHGFLFALGILTSGRTRRSGAVQAGPDHPGRRRHRDPAVPPAAPQPGARVHAGRRRGRSVRPRDAGRPACRCSAPSR